MFDLAIDFRRALRGLAARPGFTVVALLTLTLGIAATSAIFTVVDATLLRPLPYRDAGRLVAISDVFHGEPSGVGYSNYLDWRRDATAFEEIALTQSARALLGDGRGDLERVHGADVTASFFRVLGVAPAMGRPFLDSDEHQGRAVAAVILTDGLWRRLFGARPDVVGRPIVFDGHTCTVVGVMPKGFWYGEGSAAEFFVPMRYSGSGRGQHQYGAVARLGPGVSLASAQAQMSAIAARVEAAYPEAKGWGVHLAPFREDLTTPFRAPLAVLSAAVGLLLAVACANLASLLLVRIASRSREMAVRAALGAGRGRMARAVLLETLVLAAAGAAGGGVLGSAVVRAISAAVPSRLQLPMPLDVDVRVVAFCAAISLVTTLVASFVPLWRASRLDLVAELHSSGANVGVGRPHHRLLHAAVTAQLTLATLLLVAGGLLVGSLGAMLGANLGFAVKDVLTLQVQHLGRSRTDEEAIRFYREVVGRIERMPGVKAAAATWSLPLSGMYSGDGFTIEGRPAPAEWRQMSAQNQTVSPGFFGALGIRLLQGRTFDAHDSAGTLRVAVVNRALAERHWPGASPVGARIQWHDTRMTIIGVVDDVRHHGPERAAPPAIYVPLAQEATDDMFLVVRGNVDRRALVAAVRQEVRALDSSGTVSRVESLEDALGATVAVPRLIAWCMTGFAATALVLAAVGLYGAIAQWVAYRRHEVGVRLALGATRAQVAGMVVRRGLGLAVVGVGVGLGVAAMATSLMRSLLFGITPTDPLTFATVAGTLVAAALLACLAPARRAAGVDPIVTLKAE